MRPANVFPFIQLSNFRLMGMGEENYRLPLTPMEEGKKMRLREIMIKKCLHIPKNLL